MAELSFNEVEALTLKAVRGAGLAWGLAEEAAKAARWLARFGLPWAETLPALLADPATLMLGLSLLDGAATGPVRLVPTPVGQPLWLLPLLARAAVTRPLRLTTAGLTVVLGPTLCAGPAEKLIDCGPMTIAVEAVSSEARPEGRSLQRRAHAPIETLAALDRLAALTYVPASAQSRARGAGGRLDDD